MSLRTELLSSAKNEIQKSIISDLERRIQSAEADATSNRQKVTTNRRYATQYTKVANDAEARQPDLDQKVAQAKETLAVLLSAFGDTPVTTGPFQRFVGQTFHLDSKSGGKGHFLEVDTNGQLKCSCTAATFDNDCWAKKVVAAELETGNPTAWYFYGGRSNFDARVRPNSAYFRVPGYSSRPYSKYATLR